MSIKLGKQTRVVPSWCKYLKSSGQRKTHAFVGLHLCTAVKNTYRIVAETHEKLIILRGKRVFWNI
jgi:hypothetical protein